MKIKLAFVVLAATALLLTGCGGSNKPKPTVDGTVTVSGHTATLQATTTNFAIAGKDGHLHLYLDQIPTPVMLIRPTYVLNNLTSGHHAFRLELADPNHNPIGVEKTVPFDIP